MAGIGFELKRLFKYKGLLATIRAYGYTGIVCTGTMILGLTMLLGIGFAVDIAGVQTATKEMLIAMITYDLLFALLLTGVLNMVTTRAIADMIYTNTTYRIMPVFYGSTTVLLTVGCIGFAVFLFFARLSLLYCVINMLLFITLVIVDNQISFLTAIKDYKGILLTFTVAVICVFLSGGILYFIFNVDIIVSMLVGIYIGYSIMCVSYFFLMYKYFPHGKGSMFYFLKWLGRYPSLSLCGVLINLGLFGHLCIMWWGALGKTIHTLYLGAPEYEVPALCAFFSILITTINFVASVEVNFYPKYKDYFALFINKGSILDIEDAEHGMLKTLRDELNYLCQRQLFVTLIFIIFGSFFLQMLPLGFTPQMLGIYRVMCVSYAFYALGNSVMLILLYFSDNTGAASCSALFFIIANTSSYIFKDGPSFLYGYGLLFGGFVFLCATVIRLKQYLDKLKYHLLSQQKVFSIKENGLLFRLAEALDKRALAGTEDNDSEKEDI